MNLLTSCWVTSPQGCPVYHPVEHPCSLNRCQELAVDEALFKMKPLLRSRRLRRSWQPRGQTGWAGALATAESSARSWRRRRRVTQEKNDLALQLSRR